MRSSNEAQGAGNTMSEQSNGNGKPPSTQQPWWLGKAQRQHILIKFITICVVVALSFVVAIFVLHR
jgi:hypothetical protein